ncbi:MAG TPA: OB-fold domain-containing protein [Bryobacteraceae bacterium]|nr:OB-fold domain-containing protein [Bryobacteraceae bacterium]
MNPATGTVYTETVIYSAPEAFVNDVPYQTAIVSLDGGGWVTGRVLGERVSIDDRVEQVETRDGVPYFRKIA